MPQLSQDVAEALGYFHPGVVTLYAPASEQTIAAAERKLNVRFPPSLRDFYRVYDGLYLDDHSLFSLTPGGPGRDMIQETGFLRSMARPPFDIEELANAVSVANTGGGDRYVLQIDRQDERGESPIAWMDHETGDMTIAASSFERFVWFYLDKLQRRLHPDGTSRTEDEYTDEDEFEEPEEPYLPWPFEDYAWMIERDPHLARWRAPDTEQGA